MQLKTATQTEQLTPRQLQSLKAIHLFWASRCYSPTIGELACELGISRSTTFEHVRQLRKKDLLWALPGRARSLKLTSKAQKLLEAISDYNSTSSPESRAIQLVGRVAAGLPIEAIEDKEHLSLSSHFGSCDDTFALEVIGDSMIDDDIHNGDIVICRRSSVANDSQLVIATVDNENTTLKRFYKEKRRVRLQPANADYDPIYSENCRVEAVVVGLLRKF